MTSLVWLLVLLCLGTVQAASSNSSASYQTATANSSTTSSLTVHRAPRRTISPDVIASIGAVRSAQLAKPKPSASSSAASSAAAQASVTYANVSADAIHQARALVAAAHESQAAYNVYRVNNPRRNTALSKNSTAAQAAKIKRDKGAVEEPVHSKEVMDAVRLLGNVDAKARALNGTLLKQFPAHNNSANQYLRSDGNVQARDKLEPRVENDHFWMANMDHLGTQPFGEDSSYKVWRSVADYGAYGDGVTDDTAAINRAIADGNRCGVNCLSSSVKAAIVYFPLGTYRVTSPIIMYYNTQLVGYIPTAGFTPTIQVDPNFTGFGVMTSDVYLPGGTSEWYIEQSNFYRQIRNFNIDLTAAKLAGINGVHWQVAQATSITNVWFYMTDKSTSTQIGIFAENGSGGWMSDLVFEGGEWGILGGNQQYTVRLAVFYNIANAIGMIWDWGWTWSGLSIINCEIGINLLAPGSSPGDPIGSVYLMDSTFTETPVMIFTYPLLATEKGTSVITLDNIEMSAVNVVYLYSNGKVSTIPTTTPIDFITIGNVEIGDDYNGEFTIDVPTRPAALASGNFFAQESWFSNGKPSYSTYDASEFFNMKWVAAGDGVTDDTDIIQAVFDFCSGFDCIVFFPAGSYIITSTIFISIDTYVVGEAWAQLVASGNVFANAAAPTAAIVVGEPTDGPGSIQIQDLLFTSIGNLPGLVLMEWIAKASTLGSCAMWDSHFRIGGALGTDLQVAECPILSGGINSKCVAGFAMLLVTSSGYFENVWAWVADHDIDNAANTQVDVYCGRGIIVLGTGPNWFWGTAAEHSVLYQYGLIAANNVFMSMIQTESPYFQGSATTQAPLPFDQLIDFYGDPSWEDCGSATTSCNVAWALVVDSSSTIYINGAGLYSWFQNYNEACVNTANCQQKMIYIYNSADVYLNHVITIGAVEMITPALGNLINDIVLAASNLQANQYPWWSVVASYLDSSFSIDTTTPPPPLKVGWVAFGDSYAAGIGAGTPFDSSDPDKCYRGTGAYPRYLDSFFSTLTPAEIWRFYACSGAVANDVITNQVPGWEDPENADLATLSITGNDLKFADILRTCVVGTDKSRTCDEVLTASEDILDTLDIDDLLIQSWAAILEKAADPRFVIYQTGYPQFFDTETPTCDNSRFYVAYIFYGEYMTQNLRTRMDDLSVALNDRIRTVVADWNELQPRAQIVFVEPDPVLYPGHRFCEDGVVEPKYGENEKNVAFFYPGGQDIGPSGVDTGDAATWPIESYSSATCLTLSLDPWETIQCNIAVAAAGNATLVAALQQAAISSGDAAFRITIDSGGVVILWDFAVRWYKMFHPNSNFNQKIAIQTYTEILSRITSA